MALCLQRVGSVGLSTPRSYEKNLATGLKSYQITLPTAARKELTSSGLYNHRGSWYVFLWVAVGSGSVAVGV